LPCFRGRSVHRNCTSEVADLIGFTGGQNTHLLHPFFALDGADLLNLTFLIAGFNPLI